MNRFHPASGRLPHLLLIAPRPEVREALSAAGGRWRVSERAAIAESIASPAEDVDLLVLPEDTAPGQIDALLRAYSATGRPPGMLQTVADPAALRSAFAAGVEDAVRLPASPEELVARVERLLSWSPGCCLERKPASVPSALGRELRLRSAILDTLTEGVIAVDARRGLSSINAAATRMLGYEVEELKGATASLHALLHSRREDGTPLPASECPFQRVLETGEPLVGSEQPFTRRDGSVFLALSNALPIREDGNVIGLAISFTDITEQRRAEQELRRLERELAKVQSSERRQLAHDLHDSVGQTLTMVKLVLSRARAGGQEGEDVIRLVDQCIRQVRSLSFELHPEMLDEVGLVPTLKLFLEDFSRRTGLGVEVTEHGAAPLIPSYLNSYLYRAVKELLNNVAKHAQAHEALVHFHWSKRKVRVVVDDDGIGLGEGAAPTLRRGLGLETIRTWLRNRGGQLLVDSAPGQGTRAAIELPLDGEQP